MEYVLAALLFIAIAAFVAAPLVRRSASEAAADDRSEDPAVADLEARKEAIYREIRDAELDRAQGKLSAADWGRADAELRRDAIEILKALDEARGRSAAERDRE